MSGAVAPSAALPRGRAGVKALLHRNIIMKMKRQLNQNIQLGQGAADDVVSLVVAVARHPIRHPLFLLL